MPVAKLLCEGVRGSLDVRLLGLLITGPAIEPDGSKWGMEHRINGMRRGPGAGQVMGLLDGDFTQAAPTVRPLPWLKQGVMLGWRWARKEVENYLLDPVVVEQVMRLMPPKHAFVPALYRARLEQARDRLALYQAARIALSLSRRGQALTNVIHPTPRRIQDCQAGIRQRMSAHRVASASTTGAVLAQFETLRVECTSGGWRHTDYLTCFAGKDLQAELGLLEPSFQGMCLRVLQRLEALNAPNLASWLPEWTDLATAIANA